MHFGPIRLSAVVYKVSTLRTHDILVPTYTQKPYKINNEYGKKKRV